MDFTIYDTWSEGNKTRIVCSWFCGVDSCLCSSYQFINELIHEPETVDPNDKEEDDCDFEKDWKSNKRQKRLGRLRERWGRGLGSQMAQFRRFLYNNSNKSGCHVSLNANKFLL